MPRYDYTKEEVRALVEWHMSDQEEKAKEWDHAVDVYNARKRDGIGGEVAPDEAVSRNLAYEIGDALSSTLVPRIPELKITPKRKELKDAAEAQEGLTSETFRQADVESVLRKATTLASIHEYSIIKTVWKGRKRRPSFRAIQAKNVFFDLNAESWDEVAYVGELTVKTIPEIRARAKRKQGRPAYKRSVVDSLKGPGTVPAWLKTDGVDEQNAGVLISALKQHVVVELIMFDRINGKPPRLLHVIPGVDEPLLDIEWPYRYMDNPYSFVTLEVALEGMCGSSPYKLVRNLGVTLNQMESLRLATARASIPTPIVNKAGLTNAEQFFEALRNADNPNDVVEVELVGKFPLSDIIMFSQTPGNVIDFPQSINAIEKLIDTTSGLPSFLRAGNSGADFATEVQLQSHELATRAGVRRKVLNDVLVDLGIKSLQLYTEKLDYDDVVYARAAEGELPRTIGREVAALHLFEQQAGERPLEMDYTVRVVDESTQNPVIRLQALQPYLPLLLKLAETNGVKAAPIITQVLRWLGLEKAIPDAPEGMEVQQSAASEAAATTDVPGVSGAQSPRTPQTPATPLGAEMVQPK